MAYTNLCVCVPCGNVFKLESGKGIHEGRYLPGYEMHVCNSCYEESWDGYARHCEPAILVHLAEKGIDLPEQNSNGRLPRDSPGTLPD